MGETQYKFECGQIVRHKLTKDRLLILSRPRKCISIPGLPFGNAYSCRTSDYSIHTIMEEELENDSDAC